MSVNPYRSSHHQILSASQPPANLAHTSPASPIKLPASSPGCRCQGSRPSSHDTPTPDKSNQAQHAGAEKRQRARLGKGSNITVIDFR